eukprot:jgi/Orpsp1_1/1187910/evm.model.d7180000061063.1
MVLGKTSVSKSPLINALLGFNEGEVYNRKPVDDIFMKRDKNGYSIHDSTELELNEEQQIKVINESKNIIQKVYQSNNINELIH